VDLETAIRIIDIHIKQSNRLDLDMVKKVHRDMWIEKRSAILSDLRESDSGDFGDLVGE